MRIHDCRFGSLREYVANDEPDAARPAQCPGCCAENCFWKNGSYDRLIRERELIRLVKVPRFKCRFCRAVVSVLLGFLAPYRRYTAAIISECLETYLNTRTTYRDLAVDVSMEEGEDPPRPGHTCVFDWTDSFTRHVKNFLGVRVNRACVRAGKETLLGASAECPNAFKAFSTEKAERLNQTSTVLQEALVLVGPSQVLDNLRAYFLKNIHAPSDIFCGNRSTLSLSQNSELVF